MLVVAAMHLEDTDDDDLVFYILLRAVDRFYSQYSKYPGCYGDSMEADIPKLKVRSCLCHLLFYVSITWLFHYNKCCADCVCETFFIDLCCGLCLTVYCLSCRLCVYRCVTVFCLFCRPVCQNFCRTGALLKMSRTIMCMNCKWYFTATWFLILRNCL